MTGTSEVRRADDGEHGVFRVGGISYVRIPARGPSVSSAFYEAVFGWTIPDHPEHPAFEDGTGHVIGHWMPDLPVAGEAGVVPYIYVERVDETLARVRANGGQMDPAGNVLGVWQRGPRSSPETHTRDRAPLGRASGVPANG